MRLPPPEVTSQWPKPNYVDPVRRGHALTIVQLIPVVLGTIFVAMRLCARLVITQARIGLDDVLIMLAWVFSVGLTGTAIQNGKPQQANGMNSNDSISGTLDSIGDDSHMVFEGLFFYSHVWNEGPQQRVFPLQRLAERQAHVR
ncbi:hypothetical protein VE01_04428 [Pseudogymnoascus verrucosus]|uniref:Uncharacterized protein n=1 Tax=Pseudogymnoascus verrucosus TaxID=342668 RepID=A0A1B8GPA1_9PEZI|nr:uncharacterized protein VE01_04428 [Pseudogymnoascus verrucosus]OBT97657.1 hypothetical protein VE01_04428 [Pseudogymnoascus verrucosus]